MRLTLFTNTCNDPYFNLSFEDFLFQKAKNKSGVLYFYTWINKPSVIIGRNQNPFVECNLDMMRQDDISLVRRKTGGGAVYHDLGNLNYTFIDNNTGLDREKINRIVIEGLRKVGVECESSGRNDFQASGRKVSGTAYASDGSVFLQHGSILVDVNLENLRKYLTPQKSKLQKHGIQSINQRVCNLSEIVENISVDDVASELENTVIELCSKISVTRCDAKDVADFDKIQRSAEMIRSDDYLFGSFSAELKFSDDSL